MSAFIKLEDSPMFQKQLCSLEDTADELKDRCQKLYKGTRKFTEALGIASSGDTAFADSLEAFGGGQDDPVSVSIGGPVISKFINAFRELATYKELLRSQVEHVLIDRLTEFLNVDLQDAKESRRRFDKSVHAYDQAREKFVSLKKNARDDIVAELEENSKSAFEKSRFNLVSALMNIEAKKKYEFLESISAIMDVHLRYFKLGYDLLSKIEPYIHQVLTYAQQSKELANIEQDKLAQRIQEFRTQTELDNLRASFDMEPSTSADGITVGGTSSYKNIEAIMQSTARGEVQMIKQGYLLKRSSSLRGDWKRRFFVLNSQGTLYYYTNKGIKPTGSHHNYTGSAEHNGGVFSRFRNRHNRSSSFNEETLGCRSVDLHTSAIKMDADDTDLRLCFRIISPTKTYTLQAETEADRMDWTSKITSVIASLLNSDLLQQPQPRAKQLARINTAFGASCDVSSPNSHCSLEGDTKANKPESVSTMLRKIPGNDLCAECSAPEPSWASLNLGILLCIECSGVHRNLGVHISKVRSLTLDVKVWEPTILDLFGALGNAYCNSIWEGSLKDGRVEKSDSINPSVRKPCPRDVIHYKEQYIQAKYVEKLLVAKDKTSSGIHSHAKNIWEAVKTGNLREVYWLIVISDINIVNTTFDDVVSVDSYHHFDDPQALETGAQKGKKNNDPDCCQRIKESNDPGNCLQGCSLLHLACHCGNPVMLELLIQFGANINPRDFHGRTPLHHCISTRNNTFAKFLLRRGARPSIKDGRGLSSLERAMEMGAITDEELFIMLTECH
ncbi:ADP-ribosylation factor GTPase-activating protein [Melia azedarach]|uniref:ADP-ribosylation factor GTPase-activating protein n=1 Tax=Melia azedarach TaxID=155640 RepID=A0ACC1XJ26_MELAZ|nr:ADP-ribosylation factor GTPase-activating protein [Melia azedarach]